MGQLGAVRGQNAGFRKTVIESRAVRRSIVQAIHDSPSLTVVWLKRFGVLVGTQDWRETALAGECHLLEVCQFFTDAEGDWLVKVRGAKRHCEHLFVGFADVDLRRRL